MTLKLETSGVECRQQYLDRLTGEAEVLRPLVEECLDNDHAVRPTIADICKRIQMSKDVYMKESPQDVITLHQQLQQLIRENKEKEKLISDAMKQIKQLKSKNVQLRHQLVS